MAPRARGATKLKTIRKVLERFPVDQVTTLALGPAKKLKQPTVNGRR